MARRGPKQKLTWRESDAKYEARGGAKVLPYNAQWDKDVEQMNHKKVGRPYMYSHSMMEAIAICKTMLNETYRGTRGYLADSWDGRIPPSFSIIWKRIGGTMPIFEKVSAHDVLGKGTKRLIADSTGMKLSNRGEWIRVKWNVKRGFFKMHILIDLDTKRILAFELSDMNGGDAANLVKLLSSIMRAYTGEGIPMNDSLSNMILDVGPDAPSSQVDSRQTRLTQWLPDEEKPVTDEHTGANEVCITMDEKDLSRVDSEISVALRRIHNKLKKRGIHIELMGDGAYDARAIFSMLAQLGITPVIKVRINSNTSSKGVDRARTMAVLNQLGGGDGCTNREFHRMTKDERRANRDKWKKEVKFGLRWIVEIVISAFKRVLGESVRALKPYTAFIEVATKIVAYNKYLDIDDAAVKALRDNAIVERLEFG